MKWLVALFCLIAFTLKGANPAFNFPQAYGAKGDGVTDDTAAFQTALNKTGLIYVPWTTNGYLLSGLTVPDKTYISGLGGRPRLIFNWSATGYLLDCRSNVNVTLSNLELDGQSNVTFQAISTVGARSGLRVYSYGDYSVLDCDIHGFDNQGVFVSAPYATSSTGTVLTNNNTTIGLCRIAWCYTGLEYDDSSAEYQSASGLVLRDCYTGVKVGSGNVNIGLSRITKNNYGIFITGTNNNSHGNCTSSVLNHNNYPIYATNAIYGFTFLGNQIWQGNLVLHTCSGIRIVGGNLDVDSISITNGGYNLVAQNTANGTYNNTLNVSAGNTSFLHNRYNAGSLIWGGGLISEGTNILAMKDFVNGSPQEFRWYNNSATEWAGLKWSANIGLVGAQKTGGGTARDFGLYTDNTVRWRVNGSTGDWQPFLDNTYSIGTASLRPSNIFTMKMLVGPSGTAITNVLTGSANLDFPSTAANQSSDLNITVTGTGTNDVVQLGVPPICALTNTVYFAFPSNDTVWVRFTNNDTNTAQNPGPAVFKVVVTKF